MEAQQEYAILVAGGTGSRMGGGMPKQFMPVGGLPVLMHTVRQFHRYSADIRLIVVLPETQLATWRVLCEQHGFRLPATVVAGGETRFQSVRNGLAAIPGTEGTVAIHDGVRPFVPVPVIKASFETARRHGSAVAAVPLKDSLRRVAVGGSQAVDRAAHRLVQTPQTFRVAWIKHAFEQPEHAAFTDDATVAEAAGYAISLIEGDYRSLKLTTPDDLLWAETLLAHGPAA